MNLTLHFQYRVSNTALFPPEPLFQQWVETACSRFASETQEHIEIGIVIVDPKHSAALNKQYRDKPNETNVLSFNYALPNAPRFPLVGDLVFCYDTVLSEAKQQDKSVQAHWAHLTIHGVLHLLGFDHIEDQEAQLMENTEVEILASLGYNNPYTY